MIFAAIDLANYLLRRGRYSPDALRASGLRLATHEKFAGPNEAPAGSFFFLHYYRSVPSWLIMYLTRSAISHTGIHIGGGHIVDATPAGIKVRRLEEMLDKKSWLFDTREIFAHMPSHEMDGIAAAAVSNVGKKYNWPAAVWLASQAASDSNYRRQPRHPQLWADIVLSLLSPWLWIRARSRGVGFLALLPAALYLLVLTRNEVGRWATDRVRRLQDEGRLLLRESTYWGKGEIQIRSPGDLMREMTAIRDAQLGLRPIPDTPMARQPQSGGRGER